MRERRAAALVLDTAHQGGQGKAAGARIQVPRVIAVAFGDGRVRAVSGSANPSDPNGSTATLTQIDPQSNRMVGTPSHLQTPQPIAIAVSRHDLWIADYQRGLLHFKLTPGREGA